MSALQAVLVLIAAFVAGGINALVGAGTLFTFSILVAFGVPPLVANVSSSVGLVGGNVAGSFGYRERLTGQEPRIRRLVPASMLGAIAGVALLLVLPASAFRAVVPVLVLLSIVMVLVQPRLQRRVADADKNPASATRQWDDPASTGGLGVWLAVFGCGIYGGYFGAAQSVLLLGVLGTWLDHNLQRVNAIKNVLTAAVNGLAAVIFAFVAPVNWAIAGLILVGATVGGYVGARIGTRLPTPVLRGVIVVVGLVAVVVLARA